MSNAGGISSNNNFSSELLLNKLMNGQIQSNNGNTITLGTRSTSSKQSREGLAYGVSAANLEQGVLNATATQNAVTALLDQVKSIGKTISENNPEGTKIALGAIQTNLTELLKTKVDDVEIFGTNGLSTENGLGGSINIGSLDVIGGTAYAALNTALVAVAAASNDPTATPPAALTDAITALKPLLDAAIDELIGVSGKVGAQVGILSNSQDMLQSLAVDYGNAANNQIVSETGSSTGLLGNLLG